MAYQSQYGTRMANLYTRQGEQAAQDALRRGQSWVEFANIPLQTMRGLQEAKDLDRRREQEDTRSQYMESLRQPQDYARERSERSDRRTSAWNSLVTEFRNPEDGMVDIDRLWETVGSKQFEQWGFGPDVRGLETNQIATRAGRDAATARDLTRGIGEVATTFAAMVNLPDNQLVDTYQQQYADINTALEALGAEQRIPSFQEVMSQVETLREAGDPDANFRSVMAKAMQPVIDEGKGLTAQYTAYDQAMQVMHEKAGQGWEKVVGVAPQVLHSIMASHVDMADPMNPTQEELDRFKGVYEGMNLPNSYIKAGDVLGFFRARDDWSSVLGRSEVSMNTLQERAALGDFFRASEIEYGPGFLERTLGVSSLDEITPAHLHRLDPQVVSRGMATVRQSRDRDGRCAPDNGGVKFNPTNSRTLAEIMQRIAPTTREWEITSNIRGDVNTDSVTLPMEINEDGGPATDGQIHTWLQDTLGLDIANDEDGTIQNSMTLQQRKDLHVFQNGGLLDDRLNSLENPGISALDPDAKMRVLANLTPAFAAEGLDDIEGGVTGDRLQEIIKDAGGMRGFYEKYFQSLHGGADEERNRILTGMGAFTSGGQQEVTDFMIAQAIGLDEWAHLQPVYEAWRNQNRVGSGDRPPETDSLQSLLRSGDNEVLRAFQRYLVEDPEAEELDNIAVGDEAASKYAKLIQSTLNDNAPDIYDQIIDPNSVGSFPESSRSTPLGSANKFKTQFGQGAQWWKEELGKYTTPRQWGRVLGMLIETSQ